jgi:cytochrome c553
MRRFLSIGRMAVAAVLLPGLAQAGDPLAGRKKAEVCMPCHGLDGIAKIAEAPNLAGQNEIYLVEQLTGFQQGKRSNEMMNIVVRSLNDTDVADLAAYYSSIEIKVAKIPGE